MPTEAIGIDLEAFATKAAIDRAPLPTPVGAFCEKR